MKKSKSILSRLFAFALCAAAAALLSGAVPVQKIEAFETKLEIARKLYGRIMLVKSAPDYRVKIVKGLQMPDLRVKIVKKYPDAPGKWQLVNSLPDYRVEIVKMGEDLTIEFDDKNPGVHPSCPGA